MEVLLDEIKFLSHSVYKESGNDWLGKIPKHWATISNRYIFHLKKNLVGKRSGQYTLLSLTLNGVIKRDMDNPSGKFPAEFNTYQEVNRGDLIFCLFDVEETPRCVGLSEFDGMITGAYTVLEPTNHFDSKYLYYFYLNLDSDKRLKPLYTGLRNTISKENFFSFKTFVPPHSEQTAIANFLDKKTALIDKAIAIKEKQIELLKERKQILIQKAVTRGLDENVKLKDSGVEWIGMIPEHWEVKPLRFIGATQNGLSKGGEYFGTGYPFLTYGDVYGSTQLPLKYSGLAESSAHDQDLFSVKEGDVFFTRTSETIEEIGFASTCFATVQCATFAGFLIRFRPNEKLFKGFSKYYFSSRLHRSFFVGQMNLVIRASLSQELLKQLPILIPPVEEQKEIFQFLEQKTNNIEIAVSMKEKEIEKLREYKSSLINDAVTGKIKVC